MMPSLEITPPAAPPISIETSCTSTATDSAPSTTHVVLLPFMSKGHTIPLLHLAHLLHNRNIIVTIFTTPANSSFIRSYLNHTTVTVFELPFPQSPPNIPPGVESTDKLPSMSLFLPFVHATKLLQPHFEEVLSTLLPHVSCVIHDGFLPWAQHSASEVGVPSLIFFGMNTFSMIIPRLVVEHGSLRDVKSDDELFSPPFFPNIKLCRRDLNEPFKDPEPKGPLFEFVMESGRATAQSSGIVVNSFYELESIYVDFFNREFNPKAWCVGPLCTASPLKQLESLAEPRWVQWLDDRKAKQRPVLYVAFGTQAENSQSQLMEIGIGLERSGVDFLWVVRGKEVELGDGYEERVAERGMVVREWVEQRKILKHQIVRGFLSHCGWNSVLESICAEVPILAWPMMAEQPMNAKMVVEELGIGLRVKEEGGGGVVGWEKVKDLVKELMVGERGKEVGKKVKELGKKAKTAVEEGGSSWCSLGLMLDEVCRKS
ncbi:UDP-glycosyltransferase 90A1-like protein [Cinnamomum micranthum f. kanehirae]|uniref:Glycosyltransferase n=1 Tax=Cinnamomum micranthum f. kanehirae TaxID=337451 RepID=A0A3S3QHL8_9MAGN|nr:UDP-glycosyltransferase 90A1-like protein [Cinnamomum micranthum f. kanehirae]